MSTEANLKPCESCKPLVDKYDAANHQLQVERDGLLGAAAKTCAFCNDPARERYSAPFIGSLAFCDSGCAQDYADNVFEQAKYLHQFATRWRMADEGVA